MFELQDLKVRRERLYEQVAESIEELISSGKLKPGDKLPGERELALNLGVSRTVVREAVKALSERGLVTIQPGNGIFVSDLDSNHISDQVGRLFRLNGSSYRDIAVVRRILEVEIAGLAAQNATSEDLAEMKAAIDFMEAHQDSIEQFVLGDRNFHAALARSTHNKILPALLDAFVDQLDEFKRLIFLVEGAPQQGQASHKAIYAAVCEGDVERARAAMLRHVNDAERNSEIGRELAKRNPNLLH